MTNIKIILFLTLLISCGHPKKYQVLDNNKSYELKSNTFKIIAEYVDAKDTIQISSGDLPQNLKDITCSIEKDAIQLKFSSSTLRSITLEFSKTLEDSLLLPYKAGAWLTKPRDYLTFNYPSELFSPIHILQSNQNGAFAHLKTAILTTIKVSYFRDKIQYAFNPNIAQEVSIHSSKIVSNSSKLKPWHIAVTETKKSKPSSKQNPQPSWLNSSNGYVFVGLQNQKNTSFKSFDKFYAKYADHFSHIQFWGQMSNYLLKSDGKRKKASEAGCCLNKIEILQKYKPVLSEIRQHYPSVKVGYYTSPKFLMKNKKTLVKLDENRINQWFIYNEKEGKADIHYIDLVGNSTIAQPHQFNLSFLKQEQPLFVEGLVDFLPLPSLYSGGIRNVAKLGFIPYPEFGRLFFNDRIGFLGINNNEHAIAGKNQQYLLERITFLLGLKIELSLFNPDFRYYQMILDLWKASAFFEQNLVFQDEIGIDRIPNDVRIKCFHSDKDIFFTIDNFTQKKSKSFYYQDRKIAIPDKALSIIQLDQEGNYKVY